MKQCSTAALEDSNKVASAKQPTSSMLVRLMPWFVIVLVVCVVFMVISLPCEPSMVFQLFGWEAAALVAIALLLFWMWFNKQLQVQVGFQASLEALCCEAVCRGPLLSCSWTPQVGCRVTPLSPPFSVMLLSVAGQRSAQAASGTRQEAGCTRGSVSSLLYVHNRLQQQKLVPAC